MTETVSKNIDDLRYQKALIDPQKGNDPETNVEVNDSRTITVDQQQDIINIRIVPRQPIQTEIQHETS